MSEVVADRHVDDHSLHLDANLFRLLTKMHLLSPVLPISFSIPWNVWETWQEIEVPIDVIFPPKWDTKYDHYLSVVWMDIEDARI